MSGASRIGDAKAVLEKGTQDPTRIVGKLDGLIIGDGRCNLFEFSGPSTLALEVDALTLGPSAAATAAIKTDRATKKVLKRTLIIVEVLKVVGKKITIRALN